MSGNELTMDEKYFDLQNKLIETRLSSIASSLEKFGQDVKKILDDHEQRLREQAKTASLNAQESITNSTVNAQELATLRNELREAKQSIASLEAESTRKIEELYSDRKESMKKELSFWQTVGIEALKYVAFGASGGGVMVAVLKIFGASI